MPSHDAVAFAGVRAAIGHLLPLVITESGNRWRLGEAQKRSSLWCASAAHDDDWHSSVAHIEPGLDTIGWWHSAVLPARASLVITLDGVRFTDEVCQSADTPFHNAKTCERAA